MKRNSTFFLMILAVIFWSGAFIAGKYSIIEFPPFTLTFLRFSIAFIISFFLMIILEKNWRIRIKDTPYFILLGILGMFGYHVLFFIALKHTTAINCSLIGASLNPITTTLLAVIFLRDRISLRKTFWILVSFIGAILMKVISG